MKPFDWPDKAIEMLRVLADKGLTSSDIAKKMSWHFNKKLTKKSIIAKAARKNIKLKGSNKSKNKKPSQIIEKVEEKFFIGKYTLAEIKPHQCRALGQNGLYCGKEVYEKTSWCKDHYAEYCHMPKRKKKSNN